MSPLAQLRVALGKTQEQFAQLIGESRFWVQTLERGKKPIPDQLATTLMLLFGCRPDSIKKGRGKLEHLRQAGSLPEMIASWAEFLPIVASDLDVILKEVIAPKLDVLVKAASEQQRGLILLHQLDEWITSTVGKLNLQSAVDAELVACLAQNKAVDWQPLVRTSIIEDVEITIVMSDETADLMAHPTLKSRAAGKRGMPQVNPNATTRVRHLLLHQPKAK